MTTGFRHAQANGFRQAQARGFRHAQATARVDVHVLHCYEPPEWIDACLRSLESEPVHVHLCAGIQGKVGLARANAFRQGTAEYVSFVDADDEVMPARLMRRWRFSIAALRLLPRIAIFN